MIKGPKVMSMVKFSHIALNFGYDFVLIVHFFGTPCIAPVLQLSKLLLVICLVVTCSNFKGQLLIEKSWIEVCLY